MNNYEYNFWDDRTHELDINPCEGCKDFVDGECISNGGCGKEEDASGQHGAPNVRTRRTKGGT